VPTPTLYHIEISHYNEKARWALDLKGIEHERRAPLPGAHGLKSRTLGGAGTLPLLEMDGQRYVDSTDIIRAAEERVPEPPLYPSDPAEREHALAIEDLCDEQLAPAVRRLMFFHVLRGGPSTVKAFIPPTSPAMGVITTAMFPLIKPMISRQYGVNQKEVDRAPADIVGVWDRVDQERGGREFIVGDSFSVADLSAAALSHPIVRPDEFEYAYGPIPESLVATRDELMQHPIVPWIRGIYARHRPASAEVGRAVAAV